MGSIREFWRKSLQQIGWQIPLPRARVLQRRLTEVQEDNRSLRLELEAARDAMEAGIDRQARSLAELRDKLEDLEAGRDIAARQVELMQESLSLAITGQERTEQRVDELDDALQDTRDTQRVELQNSREQVRRQTRLSSGALLAAGIAVLFTAVAAVSGIRDIRENTRLLATADRDMKNILSVMQQHSRDLHESPSGVIAARTKASAQGPPETHTAPAGIDKRAEPGSSHAVATDTGHVSPMPAQTEAGSSLSREEHARQPGVISLDSGLQYRVMREGDGALPQPDDTVVVDLRIFLADGTEIYSTYAEHESAVIELPYAAPGLQMALPKMAAGSKWELFVPPELAYGNDRRRSDKYGSEPLVYYVELLSVVEPEAVATDVLPEAEGTD